MKKEHQKTCLLLIICAGAILITGIGAFLLGDITLFLVCLLNALLFVVAVKQHFRKTNDESPLL